MLFGKSLLQLKRDIDKKKVSSHEVKQYFFKRIERFNKVLNAFITINNEKTPNKPDYPLNGLPIAIKDNFCTKGLKTTASSKVLADFVPPYESTVTKRLQKAGLFILGKTNMDAWAHGSSTETSDFGPTKNPWDLTCSPGGSSGGSAAAVSSYLAPAAIGSETAGSIKQPAAWSGIVGLKPTYGRVSRYGVIAMGSSLDCPGPLTMNIEDSAYILSLIAGHDTLDATSSPIPVDDYLSNLKKKQTYTIGISEDYFEGLDKDVAEALLKSIGIFKKLGYKTKKIKLLSPNYAISVYTIIQRAEVMSNLARYDGIRYGNNRKCFGTEAKRRMMLGTYTLSYGYYDAFYKKAQKVRTLIINDFKRVFKEVDFVVGTPSPITALRLGEFVNYPFFGELMDKFNEPGAMAGIPGISFPIGLDSKGLPIAMQLTGNYFREADILNASYQFEQETDFFGVIKKGFEKYKD